MRLLFSLCEYANGNKHREICHFLNTRKIYHMVLQRQYEGVWRIEISFLDTYIHVWFERIYICYCSVVKLFSMHFVCHTKFQLTRNGKNKSKAITTTTLGSQEQLHESVFFAYNPYSISGRSGQVGWIGNIHKRYDEVCLVCVYDNNHTYSTDFPFCWCWYTCYCCCLFGLLSENHTRDGKCPMNEKSVWPACEYLLRSSQK